MEYCQNHNYLWFTDNMSRSNLVLWAKKEMESGNVINVINDQFRSPTFAEDLAKDAFPTVDHSAFGIYHLSGLKLTVYWN